LESAAPHGGAVSRIARTSIIPLHKQHEATFGPRTGHAPVAPNVLLHRL